MKWSNFHITVNFNKDDDSIVPAFREAVEAMSKTPWVWWWLKMYDGSQQVDFKGREQKSKVSFIRTRTAFEHEGKHNHGLHCHIVLEVEHDTMVQVSKPGLCDLFREFVGLTPNVHCRFQKGDGEDKDFTLKYLMKEVPAYKPKSQLNERLQYAFAKGVDHETDDAM